MKALTWDDTLSVEIDEIDEDHRRLVDLFNVLNQAIADGDRDDIIEAILDELIALTAWHFKHEERLMIKYRFDGYTAHKDEHADLVSSALELQEKFVTQGKKLLQEDIDYLEVWLTRHIFTTDMQLGTYLNAVM